MIEYYHSATRINISYNKLGIRGWQSCSRMLKKVCCWQLLKVNYNGHAWCFTYCVLLMRCKVCTLYDRSCILLCYQTNCLEQLDAKCCTVIEQAMPFLGRALRLGSQLTVLHLENSVYSGRTLMILGKFIFPMCMRVSFFGLCNISVLRLVVVFWLDDA